MKDNFFVRELSSYLISENASSIFSLIEIENRIKGIRQKGQPHFFTDRKPSHINLLKRV